jgi:hypothetical protein
LNTSAVFKAAWLVEVLGIENDKLPAFCAQVAAELKATPV